MTPIERETRCPGPSRFWEVALGGTWEPGERRHVESCPRCQAAEQAIRPSGGRRVPGEPDPDPSGPIAADAPTEHDTIGRPPAKAGAAPAFWMKILLDAFEANRAGRLPVLEALLARHPDLA